MTNLEARLAMLERQNRLLLRTMIAALAVIIGVALWQAAPAQSETGAQDAATLRVRMLEIVDAKGTVRVRVGSDLPEAIIDGKSVSRGGEQVSGVMLYDGTGQERGGYVTFEPSGNIGLTLDTRKQQVALFAAGPENGATLRLWDGADAIELRADTDGTRLTSVVDGAVALQLPGIAKIGAEACTAYREAARQVPMTEVRKACSGRFADELCQQCLAE
jgi:hypothetical protein